MLKRKLLTLILMPAAIGSIGFAQADDGVIHFTGTISTAACTVSSVAGSGTTIGTVNMGQISSSTLSSVGSSTTAKPFTIELSDCSVGSAPDIAFKGTAVTAENYTNLFASQVEGVGIRLEDAGQTSVTYSPGIAASNSGFSGLAENINSATGRFNAYLVSYDDQSPSGNIDTDITFVIDYSNS